MKVVFSSLAYPELSLEDVVERVSKFGFDGLELRVADDGKHLKPEFPINKEELAILSSIRISDLAGYARFSSPDETERKKNEKVLETLIKMANTLNALGVRVYGGEFSDEGVIHRIVQSLKRMNRVAQDYSVKILIETHDSLAKKDNIVKLLGELDEEDIGFVYDPANVIFAGDSHDDVFPLVVKRIYQVHVKDFIIKDKKRVFVEPGKGIVPLEKIINDLKRIGYKYYISVEWEKIWHPELENADNILPKYLSYLRNLLYN
ncbi:TIM barrel protein [Sulfolobus sp. E5-1-F]|uniref:sugar phosphate isomerase/epimerase family protein n=1 Tax=Saccharolobus sp. E5-1-F TaxID=2663019 RepID=UPI00129545A5|nr:sugar phosphate isomerase/epimerase family protein [Sulfolobus sp. E5-1-F]QGA55334.1 TIM barrel protein [Sulfolobus sp. E5-1-F]